MSTDNEIASFIFKASASDIKLTSKPHKRDVVKEMREQENATASPESMHAAEYYAKLMVYPSSAPPTSPNEVYEMRNIIFSLDLESDREAFNKLMNSPNYHIFSMESTWTRSDSFKMFVIYGKLKNPEEEDAEDNIKTEE